MRIAASKKVLPFLGLPGGRRGRGKGERGRSIAQCRAEGKKKGGKRIANASLLEMRNSGEATRPSASPCGRGRKGGGGEKKIRPGARREWKKRGKIRQHGRRTTRLQAGADRKAGAAFPVLDPSPEAPVGRRGKEKKKKGGKKGKRSMHWRNFHLVGKRKGQAERVGRKACLCILRRIAWKTRRLGKSFF